MRGTPRFIADHFPDDFNPVDVEFIAEEGIQEEQLADRIGHVQNLLGAICSFLAFWTNVLFNILIRLEVYFYHKSN